MLNVIALNKLSRVNPCCARKYHTKTSFVTYKNSYPHAFSLSQLVNFRSHYRPPGGGRLFDMNVVSGSVDLYMSPSNKSSL